MSKVLTWDEYEALEKEKAQTPVYIKDEKPDEATPIPAESSNKIYCLMYPDNPVDNYHNGIFKIDNEELEITNGIIRTESESIKNKLIQKGFLFLQSKEKTDEQ